MLLADRFRLLGRYRSPRVRIGSVQTCELRDADVVVTGYSTAPIPWPVGHRKQTGGRPGVVLYGDLAKAVRRESSTAVCHWWGVSGSVVARWRKALGVARRNEGSDRLLREAGADPRRRGKIAAAKRGVPRPPSAVAAAHAANRCRVPTAEQRAAMAERGRRRSQVLTIHGRAWTEEELVLLRTLPAKDVALRTGRPLGSVYSKLQRMRLPDGRWRRAG